jgi:hypothetical protein
MKRLLVPLPFALAALGCGSQIAGNGGPKAFLSASAVSESVVPGVAGDGCFVFGAPTESAEANESFSPCGGRVCSRILRGQPVYVFGEAGASLFALAKDDVVLDARSCKARTGARVVARAEELDPVSPEVPNGASSGFELAGATAAPAAPPAPSAASPSWVPASTSQSEEACLGFLRLRCREPWDIIGTCWGKRDCP